MTVDIPTDFCESAIAMASRRVVRRYRGYVEPDDLASEARIWMQTHQGWVLGFFRDVAPEETKLVMNRQKQFASRIERVMERYAREAKASKLGYNPDDQFIYGKAVLDEVLPALFSDEYAVSAPVGEQPEVKGSSDPAESGNWQTYVLDVRIAAEKARITDAEHTALLLKYGMGLQEQRASDVMAVSRFVYRDMVERVMRRITFQLNGVTPEPRTPAVAEGAESATLVEV